MYIPKSIGTASKHYGRLHPAHQGRRGIFLWASWLYKQLFNNLFLSSVVLVAPVQYDKLVSGLDILDNHIPTKL